MLDWIFKILAIIISASIFTSIIYFLFNPILSRFNDKIKTFAVVVFFILSVFLYINMIINSKEESKHCGYVGLWGWECSE
jgi:membrane protein DedA with SNARE-associated domain